MTYPKPAGWYVWADSPQSDHLVAHWLEAGAIWAVCDIVAVQPKDAIPATFQRHCKRCERALAKGKNA